ncbi:helix-turn-helix DNA binding domain protein [Gordonia phage PCoral7]|nr:helix-turn-helix DNA binding domain protein [Gordonia phage PCoral7]
MNASRRTPHTSEDRHVTAPRGLSVDDRRILDFAALRWNHSGNQADAVRTEFGMSVTRFWQRVNNLLDDPAALEHAPALVNRLRRLRSRRR